MNLKLKNPNISWLVNISLILLIFLLFIHLYSPKPGFSMILEFLQAKSISTTQTLIDKKYFQLVSNAIGIPQLTFPAILLTPFITLITNTHLLLLLINYFMLAISGLLLISNISKNDNTKVVGIVLFVLSPIVFTTITTSIGAAWLLLLFSVYLSSTKEWIKNFVTILAILSSFAAWPLFLLLTFFELFEKKQKGHVYARLIIISFLIAFLSKNATGILLKTYFPILKIKTHGFYLDTHRQADLVGSVPLVGRLFYNKYFVVVRKIFEETLRFFDWDFLVFHTATGKFTSRPPTFALISIFELPILIYGIFLGFTKKIKGLKYLLMASVSLALFQYDETLILIYWLAVFYLILQTLTIINQKIPKKAYFIYFALILLGRVILINHSQMELGMLGNKYKVYEELANYLKNNETIKPVFITDRLGQPHIYLTFFGVTSLESTQENLAKTSRRDSEGLLQPDGVEGYVFSSFEYNDYSGVVKDYKKATYVEFKENFSDLEKLEKEGQLHELDTKITRYDLQKDYKTNLLLYIRK